MAIPNTLAACCDPTRTALIVYDMQAGVVSQLGDGPAIVSRCVTLLQAARSAGYPIYFTRHMWLPNRLAGIGQFRRAMIWQKTEDPTATRPPFARGSALWQIVPELEPQDDEVVIDKITMSAFEGTYLHIAMRDAHLQAFIIAGIALEVGIAPTVRHGADLNLIPIVVSDACGARTPQNKARVLEEFADTGEVFTVDSPTLLASMAKNK